MERWAVRRSDSKIQFFLLNSDSGSLLLLLLLLQLQLQLQCHCQMM